jgi:hypothetical protein
MNNGIASFKLLDDNLMKKEKSFSAAAKDNFWPKLIYHCTFLHLKISNFKGPGKSM